MKARRLKLPNCLRHIVLVFSLCVAGRAAFTAPAPAPDPRMLALPPLFGHNMVLQREARNLFWGKTEPKAYVEVQFSDLVSSVVQANKVGEWRLELDLRDIAEAAPGKLFFSLGWKKKAVQPVLVLTNVAVGDVLLMGVLGKGVPYQLPEDQEQRAMLLRRTAAPSQYLRFATCKDFGGGDKSCTPEPGAWHLCAPESAEFQQLSALAFIWTFTQANRPLGIVQTDPQALTDGLPEKLSNRSLKDRERRRMELSDNRLVAYILATNQVAMVEQRNERILREAKIHGRVTNLPPVIQYDKLDVFLREEFDPDKPPGSVLTFDAAIW